MRGFDLARLDLVKAWHSIIEAERLAYADRAAYLGDPEYVDVPVPGLLSSGFAAARRGAIGDRASDNEATFRATAGNPLPYQSDPSPSMTAASPTATTSDQEGLSTTHIVVSDREGNVVSYTLTIESTGGSGIVAPGYGFILNNELTDFDPISPHPNSPEPGQRPRSSMAPTIAFALCLTQTAPSLPQQNPCVGVAVPQWSLAVDGTSLTYNTSWATEIAACKVRSTRSRALTKTSVMLLACSTSFLSIDSCTPGSGWETYPTALLMMAAAA